MRASSRWRRRRAAISPRRLLTCLDRDHAGTHFDGRQLLGPRRRMSHCARSRVAVERFLGMPKSSVVIVEGS